MATPAHTSTSTLVTITQADIDLYAEVSGDRNPIHIDPGFARTGQFGRTIAHGQLILGHLARVLLQTLGPDWNEHGQLEVKFVRPVFVDSTIEIRLQPAPDQPAVLTTEVRTAEAVALVGRAWLTPEAD